MSAIGDCFVVMAPNCSAESVIFGRNSQDVNGSLGEAQEVEFYSAKESAEGKCDGGAEPEEIDCETLRLILQKPRPGCWGGDCGANERNICIGISWSCDETSSSNVLRSTDVVRYVLATSCTAAAAVERIGALVGAHGADNAKCSYVVCDPSEAWAVSSGGKLWAAQRFTDGCHRFPTDGLAVSQTIDKSSEELGDALKTLGLWSGDGEVDFSASFGAASSRGNDIAWSGGEAAAGDGTYALTSMFATLRSAASAYASRSANVSVLSAAGISCHWFTGTPNVAESVFKPFVFAPNPRISPLTKVADAAPLTLLHQLHALRKPTAVEDLKALEASCVDEVAKYLDDHPSVDDELDELMKDCVEAEVKFYR